MIRLVTLITLLVSCGRTELGGPSTAADAFAVEAPVDNENVSGVIHIRGTAGSNWINVAAYELDGDKLTTDVTPRDSSFDLALDTTTLSNGLLHLVVIAFTVPAGEPDDNSEAITLDITIAN